jgi:uncharacterized membrane protein YeiH
MEIPAVLKKDLYATAALMGGACFVVLGQLHASDGMRLASTIVVTVCLRFMAMRYGMRLPRVKGLGGSPSELTQRRDRAATPGNGD